MKMKLFMVAACMVALAPITASAATCYDKIETALVMVPLQYSVAPGSRLEMTVYDAGAIADVPTESFIKAEVNEIIDTPKYFPREFTIKIPKDKCQINNPVVSARISDAQGRMTFVNLVPTVVEPYRRSIVEFVAIPPLPPAVPMTRLSVPMTPLSVPMAPLHARMLSKKSH